MPFGMKIPDIDKARELVAGYRGGSLSAKAAEVVIAEYRRLLEEIDRLRGDLENISPDLVLYY